MATQLKFHPGAQILSWCLLVAALQIMRPGALAAVAGAVLVFAFAWSRQGFLQLVRRTRWIMFSLLAIYAYSTPGAPLAEAAGWASPTREGLSDGAVQLARLLAALASLALFLERLRREELIAGLYSLLRPMPWLGKSRERIAVRLALTLQYAEAAVFRESHDWRKTMHSLIERPLGSEANGVSHDAGMPYKTTGVSANGFELPAGHVRAGDVLLLSGVMLMLWLAL